MSCNTEQARPSNVMYFVMISINCLWLTLHTIMAHLSWILFLIIYNNLLYNPTSLARIAINTI